MNPKTHNWDYFYKKYPYQFIWINDPNDYKQNNAMIFCMKDNVNVKNRTDRKYEDF